MRFTSRTYPVVCRDDGKLKVPVTFSLTATLKIRHTNSYVMCSDMLNLQHWIYPCISSAINSRTTWQHRSEKARSE